MKRQIDELIKAHAPIGAIQPLAKNAPGRSNMNPIILISRLQMKVVLGSLLLSACCLHGAGIDVPPDNHLLLSAFGDGFQIYDSASDGHGGFMWKFTAPSAILYTDSSESTRIGMHFAGPTWELDSDHSSVVGNRIASIASPNPNSIPELLLSAKSHGGVGLLDEVTYIQRLDTVGGLAPTVLPTGLNQESRSPYTATYDFFAAPDNSSPIIEAAALGLLATLGWLEKQRRDTKHATTQ
jgi:hypothetical protein